MENQIDNPLLIALVLPSSPQKMSAALESTDFIASKIHFWKGEKVLFDSDLAVLYGVPPKVLKQAVRRNRSRFPKDFMIELTMEEWPVLRSQIVTLEKGRGKYSKYPPMAFTELRGKQRQT